MLNFQRINLLLRSFALFCCAWLLLPSAYAESDKNNKVVAKQFSVKDAKLAQAASQAMALHSQTLRELMLTLYMTNPKQLRISTQVSAEEMVQWTFEGPFSWKFDGVRRLQGIDALKLAVDADFPGDRVLALIAGLHTMLAKAYGAKNEYDFSGEIYPQYLYNAARNIEMTSANIKQLHEANQSLPNQLVILDSDKSTDLTQKLSSLISRVDVDANHFADQTKQRIEPMQKEATRSAVWQKTSAD